MLDVALVIGIITSLLNIGDFLLRPHQKESFQKAMENLVLWLDYTRPLSLIYNIRSIQRWQIGSIGICLLIASMILVSSQQSILIGRMGLIFIIYSLILIGSVPYWNWANLVFDYIDSRKDVIQVIVRSLGVISAYFVIQIIYILVVKFSEIGSLILGPVVLAICIFRFRWILAYNAAFAVSMIALSSSLALLIIESVFRILRFLGWRILEYSKGSWAAIILLATVVLGLIKLFLK